MDNEQLQKITSLCVDFRSAIEAAVRLDRESVSWFERFPVDCCDLVSKLLFLFLYEQGVRGLVMVSADVPFVVVEGRPARHVWLECDRVAIDITADQFDPAVGPVIVSADSAFHQTLGTPWKRWLGDGKESELEFFKRLRSFDPADKWYQAIFARMGSS